MREKGGLAKRAKRQEIYLKNTEKKPNLSLDKKAFIVYIETLFF
jgi:hypothetical protein